jgi:hypothetical protein
MKFPWADAALLLFNLATNEERKQMFVQVLNTVWREASGILGQIVNGVLKVIRTGVEERLSVSFTVLGRIIGIDMTIRVLSTNGGAAAPGATLQAPSPAGTGGVIG